MFGLDDDEEEEEIPSSVVFVVSMRPCVEV